MTTLKQPLLGVGLLQQGAPELSRRGGAAEEQHSIPADRQKVVHDHIRPAAESPEPEMKDSRVQVRTLRIPLLVHVVGDDLGGGGDEVKRKEGRGMKGKRSERSYDTFFHRDGSDARQEMAATIQQLPRLPWCRSRVLMPSTNRRGSLQISWKAIKTVLIVYTAEQNQ